MAADDTLSQLSNTDWTTFAVLSNPDHVTDVPYTASTLPPPNVIEEEPRVVDITPPAEAERPAAEQELPRQPEAADTRHEPPPEYSPPIATILEEERPREEERRPQEEEQRPREEEQRPREEERPPPQFLEPRPSEDEETKRTLLLDLQALIVQGMQPTKQYSMDDRTEDIMLEIRRLTLAMDEASNVGMMRDGLRLFVTGVEMVNSRIGLLDLEGWSADVCRDMNKHDPNLSRIYRRWWKRSTSSSPELDLCLSLVGSMGFHHMKRTMSKQLISGGRNGFSADRGSSAGPSSAGGSGFRRRPRPQRPATPPSSEDDEGLPPAVAR